MVGYMTMGMDMSPLMPKVISAANLSPDDVLLKKMMYLYICTYAKQKPEFALMAINQLRIDCKDADPNVRGLALRSLCSLRVANLLEYVVDPILEGLSDRHPYVQRTAVMGVLKVHHIEQSVAESRGLVVRVSELMMQTQDPAVLGNCLFVMAAVDGYSKLTSKAMVYKLLTKLKEFSEWHQCQVLETVSHYNPETEQEVYDIMNVLEDRLTSTNSAIAIAVVKVFLFLTLSMPATHQQVLDRIREPLRLIISREQAGVTYTILSHILLLAQRAPIMFAQEYATFYCRTDDPMYIKRLKLEILSEIVDNSNAYEIASELTEYVRDINPVMAQQAVKAVGKVALAVPDVSGIIERLIGFLEYGDQEIIAETLVQMKDLLRRYPDMCEVCIPAISSIVQNQLNRPDARCALVWILGHHGEMIQEAPYILEDFAKGYAKEEPSVRLALLTAAAKLFFKRPPECQLLLGGLLTAGVQDDNQDVHDRALLYFRLLKLDVKEAEKVISHKLPTITQFSEDLTPEIQDKIFDEFNSFSVIYKCPAATFIDSEAALFSVDDSFSDAAPSPSEQPDNDSSFLKRYESDAEKISIASAEVEKVADLPAPEGEGGLLDLDDLLGPSSPPPPQTSLELDPTAFSRMTPQDFQNKWLQFSSAINAVETLSPSVVSAMARNGHQDFCNHMKHQKFHVMASGGDASFYKYYFYAQPVGQPANWFLIEFLVNAMNNEAKIQVKSDIPSDACLLKFKETLFQFNC